MDTFLAKARTCEDIYSRYVNPLVAAAYHAVQSSAKATLAPGNAHVQLSASAGGLSASEEQMTVSGGLPRASVSGICHFRAMDHNIILISLRVEQTSAASLVEHSGLPTSLPWRDNADDRACGLPVENPTEPPKLRDTFLASLIADLVDVDIYLPSLYHSLIRRHPLMAPVVKIERELREGEAHDALNELRLQIMAQYSLRDLDDQGAGQAHGKKVREMQQTHKDAATRFSEEYRRICSILRCLGMPEDDSTFQVLKEADRAAFAEKRKINESRTTRSWLWADFTILSQDHGPEVNTFLVESK